jgi:hypothetical protein
VATLSALLPLKVRGRHYGDNLARLDLLFSSLVHYAEPGLLDELIVVIRSDERELVERFLGNWSPRLPVRTVVEDDHFPAFRRYTKPWQVRPWQRQQIIKLNAPAFTDAPFVLVLDPDVMAVKPISRDLLLPEGRAVLEPEARSVHRQWWIDSAGVLDVDPGLDRKGMGVTPAILATEVITSVQGRLSEVSGKPWMDTLLTSYCDWTEYTLYLLEAERAGLLERLHVWSDDPAAPAPLQLRPEISIWDAERASRANIEQLFTTDDRGLFAVLQSNTGLPASDVIAAAREFFEVRVSPAEVVQVPDSGSKLQERARIASRLLAQRIYRLRRAWRARRRRREGGAK